MCHFIGLIALQVTAGTLRNYERHLKLFHVWLEDLGYSTLLDDIHPDLIVHCFEDIWHAGYCYATPNALRSGIALAFRRALRDPPYPTDHPSVKSALKGYKRAAACRSVKRMPIVYAMYCFVLQFVAIDVDLDERNQVHAAVRLGYELLLRVSEVLAICVHHLLLLATCVEITIPSSKTDQLARGITFRITDPTLCRLLAELVARVKSGPLFSITATQLNAIIRAVAARGHWQGYYSFHSLRHGKATDLWLSTGDILLVMRAGRWSTAAATRWYIHKIVAPPATC